MTRSQLQTRKGHLEQWQSHLGAELSTAVLNFLDHCDEIVWMGCLATVRGRGLEIDNSFQSSYTCHTLVGPNHTVSRKSGIVGSQAGLTYLHMSSLAL